MEHRHFGNEESHEAVNGLLNLFTKANNDLNIVQNRLVKEFDQIYPQHANPMKLVSRIKKIQDDISSLKDQCRELLAAKQNLIDKASATIVGNRSLLQRLQASAGVTVTSDSDDTAYTSFNEIIEEWTAQIRSTTDGEGRELESSEDINQMLFSAIVQGN